MNLRMARSRQFHGGFGKPRWLVGSACGAVVLCLTGLLMAPSVAVGSAASLAPTQVSISAAAKVLSNVSFVVSGRGQYLFNGSWVGLNNQLVTLQTGRTSTGPWVWLAYLRTSSTGTFSLTTRTSGSIFYRAVVAATTTIAQSTSAPLLVTVVPPPAPPVFDQLPLGSPPLTMAYSIGTRVFYGGHEQDLATVLPKGWGPQGGSYLTRVVASRGVVVVATHVGYGTVESGDAGSFTEVGLYWPTRVLPGAYRVLVTAGNVTSDTPPDVTTAGAVLVPAQSTPGQVTAFNLDGSLRAVMPLTLLSPGEVAAVGVRAYASSQLSSPASGNRQVALWWVGGGTQNLPVTYEPVGRLGLGWLGVRAGLCWRVAPADNPLAVRAAALCSMTRPLVSADGSTAVVVQSGRVRVLDTRTGHTISVAQLPALAVPTWGYDHYAVPAAWETSDLYLVNVRDSGVSALVRCSVSSGRCWRVVRTTAALRTERGHESIVYGNPTYPRA